jgi:NDP-sugar pyrophosphorylase family protein
MDKINLIVPCAGCGQRFIDAGFSVYKPLISALGKPMICHMIDAFPKKIIIWIITDENHKPALSDILAEYDNIHFVLIEPHKLGPAWSIVKAEHDLPLHESCFIAYNDVMWDWNYNNVQNFIKKRQPDGIVFTQTGYHPHLYKNNFSAFCKTIGNQLLEIKEKGCFTNDWINEPLSTGVYYFSNTSLMLANAKLLVERNIMTAGEFFPSEIFNLMLTQGLSVNTYETNAFLHMGIPEQLSDAEEWKEIINSANKPNNLPLLIMMCGEGIRMKTIAKENKAGISIGNMAMYEFVAKNMGSDNNTFLVNDETLPIIKSGSNTINIHAQTISQTESLKNALSSLPASKDLLVISNDCYGIFGAEDLEKFRDYKIVLFGFKPRLIQKKQGGAHTGFSFSGTSVIEIHIKNLLKEDLGLAGMYYFPDKSVLEELEYIDCSKEVSIDHFAQNLLLKKYKVGFLKLDHYVHLGTPEEFNEYLFWKSFFYKNSFNPVVSSKK